MASAALQDFYDYIAARKALADTYIANKKAQVDAQNVTRKAAIDAGAGNAAGKTAAKAQMDLFATHVKGLFDTTGSDIKTELLDVFVAKSEDFYARVVKEFLRHADKHLDGALVDGDIQQTTHDAIETVFARLLAEDGSITVAFAKGDFN